MKTFSAIIGSLIAVIALVWLFQGNDFFMYKFWAPKYEEARREVFENTPSYKWGMIQELQNMQFKYEQATPDQKDALAAIILRRANQYGEDRLPVDLRAFVTQLKSQQAKEKY
ncbi:MAG: hypothetical protein WC593_15685 [Methanoregula sp.]